MSGGSVYFAGPIITGTQTEERYATPDATGVAIKAYFRDTGDITSSSSIVQTLTSPKIDVTAGYDEQVTLGSARFKVGSLVYVDRGGVLYHSIDPTNNAGTLGGAFAYGTGEATLADWIPGEDNAVELQSLITQTNVPPVNYVSFRLPITPVRPSSLQVVANTVDGVRIEFTAPSTGVINTSKVRGTIDYQFGVVVLEFGTETEITVDNQASIQAQDWYDEALVYQKNSKNYIRYPVWVLPDSITYSAVGYSYLPLSADVLKLDPVRLPGDGKVPIFRQSDVVIVTCNTKIQIPNPEAGGEFDIGQVRLSTLRLVDNEGTVVDTDLYTANLNSGVIEFLPEFEIGDLIEPLFAEVRYQDMALATDVQINGIIRLSRPLSHTYPMADTLVSSALIVNDLQARAYNVFSQNNWVVNWANSRDTAAISSQYNTALNPIGITNIGAIQERWALIFTSNLNYNILGEEVGFIGAGNINTDCSPINPATNQPYFTIKATGWGGGWVAGNVLRFNTDAANIPVWVVRTVLQGQETDIDDSFVIQTRGDIDRP